MAPSGSGGGRVARQKTGDRNSCMALAGDVTACIFYLKNRRPDRWRDVQNIQADVGHYIISDKPMTEEEWIAARADRAKPVQQDVARVSRIDVQASGETHRTSMQTSVITYFRALR
jgi:hypothetical protein